MARPLYATLALSLILSAPAVSQDSAMSEWNQLLEQDARISFTSRTELAALTAIEAGGLDQGTRAAALFALGASGSNRGRAHLESSLSAGSLRERCAAVLALGEMGVGVRPLLESLRHDSDPLVSECALLALMRTGRWAAAEYVEAVSESGDEAQAQMAGKLLLFATNAPASEATAASTLLLELRWDAAKHFGLVDQRAWEVVLIEGLAKDLDFLKGFILKAAAENDRPGTKDHFRSLVEAERRDRGAATDQTIRAALRAMPKEVSLLVESGLWSPDWNVLLQEIRDRGLEQSTRGLLEVAKGIPSTRYPAVSLLARAKDREVLASIPDEIKNGDLGPMQKIWCCEALGVSGDQAALPVLHFLSQSPGAEVAAAAKVQLARMGDEDAADQILEVLNDPDSPIHFQVVDWVSNGVEAPELAALLLKALPQLRGGRALQASIALSFEGYPEGRERLREILAAGLPRGKLGARAVEALEDSGSAEDLAYLKQQFPHEIDAVVNEALALAMYRARDPRVLTLIRAGIWDSIEFDQSVLASALLIEVAGMRALIDEARYEPMLDADSTGARYRAPKYPRRVGYALGLWGGIQALEDLNSEVSDVREDVRQGAVLGALASRTHGP
jgi:HEAT repeat protein